MLFKYGRKYKILKGIPVESNGLLKAINPEYPYTNRFQ